MEWNGQCGATSTCYFRKNAAAAIPPCCSGTQPTDDRDYCVPAVCTAPGIPISGGASNDADDSDSVSADDPSASKDTGNANGNANGNGNGGGNGGGGGGGGGGDPACFSGDTLVNVQHKGPVYMKDLRVGDSILTSITTDATNTKTYGYETVYSFAHFHPTREATFLVIDTDNGINRTFFKTHHRALEVTADHLVFLHGKKKDPVRAKTLQVGDKLAPTGATITKITTVEKQGIYAPITPSGMFLTVQPPGNDDSAGIIIQVSSYAAIVQYDTSSAYVQLQDGTTLPFFHQHRGIHMLLTPFRMACTSAFTNGVFPVCESYNDQGLPHYVARGIDILTWAQEQSKIIQLVLFASGFILFGAMMSLERFIVLSRDNLGWEWIMVVLTLYYSVKTMKSFRLHFKVKSA